MQRATTPLKQSPHSTKHLLCIYFLIGPMANARATVVNMKSMALPT